MRRALLLSLLLLAVLAPSALAGSLHGATFTGWDFDFVQGGTILRDVTVEVDCPGGYTFAGKVTLRTGGGNTVFNGKVNGTCTGHPLSVHTFGEQASVVPCGVDMTLSGQIRSTDGAKFFASPKIQFNSCT